MELPESDIIDVSSLSNVFDETTNSYKFYWFLAILDILQRSDNPRISMQDLSLQMVANVWYPLNYYRLSFGVQDQFKTVSQLISNHITIDEDENVVDLFKKLRNELTNKELLIVDQAVKRLLRWVPYRFIRPFFKLDMKGVPEGQANTEIIKLANNSSKAPYRFDKNTSNDNIIVINESWLRYFQRYQYILRGFINWHLIRYLQKNNPNVAALSEKLERPLFKRDFKIAKPFWRAYIEASPQLVCIYSGQAITRENLSIDHYLPFSFVAHNQLWNLVPTVGAVNSAKSDWLPDEQYFSSFAKLQFDAFQFHAKDGASKKLEDYTFLFRENIQAIQNSTFEWFCNHLKQAVTPQYQTAQNMGFSHPFIYRKS